MDCDLRFLLIFSSSELVLAVDEENVPNTYPYLLTNKTKF